MKHSIRFRFTLVFTGTVAVIIGLCIGINTLFLEKFYLKSKEKVLNNAYGKMNAYLSEEGIKGETDVERFLLELRNVNSISAIVVDSGGELRYVSASDPSEMWNRLRRYLFLTGGIDEPEILYSSDNFHIFLAEDPTTRTDYMEGWGFSDSGCLFLLSLPLESVQESAEISNKFYTFVGIAGILVGTVLMFYMTRRLTKPVLELSSISEKMAKLDFQARYEGSEDDEVGILGTSMNHMADALQKAISELQEANRQLQKDIEEKEQIDNMRKEFLSNVSHELKTPIAIIQGYAEGLRDGINEDEEGRNYYCDVIVDEAGKMNQMVKKLLTLNQLEFGDGGLEWDTFDIMELIAGVIHASEVLIRQKGGTVFLPEGETAIVVADEFMIEEVLKNYLSNAIHHLDGEKRIEISLRAQQGRLRVGVFNTGAPIPEDSLDKIWIKFYKVDKARTREYGGSGIGLSIVKAIMDQHGQECGVVNREDGVEFWFTMKLSEPSPPGGR